MLWFLPGCSEVRTCTWGLTRSISAGLRVCVCEPPPYLLQYLFFQTFLLLSIPFCKVPGSLHSARAVTTPPSALSSQWFEVFYMLISPFLFSFPLWIYSLFVLLILFNSVSRGTRGSVGLLSAGFYVSIRETHTQLLRLYLCIKITVLSFPPKRIT